MKNKASSLSSPLPSTISRRGFIALMAGVAGSAVALSGCTSSDNSTDGSASTDSSVSAADASTSGVSSVSTTSSTSGSFHYGTTGYGTVNDDAGLNPHENYSGWSCVRYGVGETLFKFSDAMEPVAWLATDYAFDDDTTLVITLRDGVSFTSGRAMDAQAVKECLDDLVATHDRAPGDLQIDHIDADGQTLTIHTIAPNPSLVNYLCDPYAAIIDMQAGVSEDKNVAGTGPYIATSVTDDEVQLVPNDNYWGAAVEGEVEGARTPQVANVTVTQITDGDTLTFSLQSGDIQASYGLPYASYALFSDESQYSISSCETSRVFFAQVNYASDIMQDDAVRQAIAMGIDKEGFVTTLLNGRGAAAIGAFPSNFAFGGDKVSAPTYDPDAAKQLLEDAGWTDSDGDGVREKDGTKLTLRWLTYPSRQELPLLAESAQATLGEIGFDVQVNNTANHTEVRADTSAWDVYASALVTAPTGDPAYFFKATCTSDATKNFGHYSNAQLDDLIAQLDTEFDTDTRTDLTIQAQQLLLDDAGFVFVSHLTMGIVSVAGVSGMAAHPCDYYEITADLSVE